ncbi:flagellar biosynthetic protein FliR [Dongia sedimenti]|uniref:Flagellar biosynthetic protein FliR n=1 Tax=Dongia sedimenti TaxID=3064282 RepID=A0ABU0YJC0_9PROT|nr:flagellar biosynthetic protein FliR [Rhodospirillaceae bacterium R-7]
MPPGETLESLLNGSIFQFFMVFCRVGSAIMLIPGWGEAYVPPRVRLIFALMFSLALMPMLADKVPVLPADLDRFVMALTTEIGIGLFFGSLCRIIMMAVLSAGSIIALQTGIANALSVDPTTAQQAAVTGNFLIVVTLVLIFATGLDHTTLQALVGTYAVMPPGRLPPLGDFANFDARAVSDSFALAVQMSAPFLVYGLVFTGAMGLLARLMPTLQVFFVAMPAQLLIGLGLLAVTLSSMMIWFLDSYERQIGPFLSQ